ncbi:MAG: class I SAM-dependent methyltransferase, partial [Candidatus Omnitrophica bacterium]|nr:class I SAM-dependent methyltransferase [Candidatus Omnitrophota bacterium]
NEQMMLESYLPGLYLSHYLWPHHYRLLRFFVEAVLPAVGAPSHFLDIGAGTGIYSLETLRSFPSAKGLGIDISPSSAAFTERLIAAHRLSDRFGVRVSDATADNSLIKSADFVICQEVLEHLENPLEFCRALTRMLRPSGRLYVTAAVNAAHPDHIHLFSNPAQAREMLLSAGLKIILARTEYADPERAGPTDPCIAAFYCIKSSADR